MVVPVAPELVALVDGTAAGQEDPPEPVDVDPPVPVPPPLPVSPPEPVPDPVVPPDPVGLADESVQPRPLDIATETNPIAKYRWFTCRTLRPARSP
jgi:hypothetical protein